MESHVIHDEPLPKYAIQLVGLSCHLISEDQPWRDPVLHARDGCGAQGVCHCQWSPKGNTFYTGACKTLHPLLEEAKDGHVQSSTLTQNADVTLEALQLMWCLMMHPCCCLVLYSAVPSLPKPSNRDGQACSQSEGPKSSTRTQ